MEMVHRFYDEYYFRPRVAWRFVRGRLWDADSRRILYHEAVDFLRLRAQRRKLARKGMKETAVVAVWSVEANTPVGSHST